MAGTMNLYELSLESLKIQDLLIANEGELSPELEQRMDALLQEGPQCVEAAAMVVRGLEASAMACKAESDRLKARAEGLSDQAEHLKSRMAFALDAAFSGKVKTPLFTIWSQSAAPVVRFELSPTASLDGLPEQAVKVVKSLDTGYLRDAYKRGEQVDGVEGTEIPGTRYVRIK